MEEPPTAFMYIFVAIALCCRCAACHLISFVVPHAYFIRGLRFSAHAMAHLISQALVCLPS